MTTRITRASVSSNNNSNNTNSNSNTTRRNPFHQRLGRRPTVNSTATSATATTIIQGPAGDATEEIVVRDKDGKYQFEVPSILAAGQDLTSEKDREDARLAEAIKYHLRNRNRRPSEPADLLAAVQQSLRDTVASLKEDNWLYEGDRDDE